MLGGCGQVLDLPLFPLQGAGYDDAPHTRLATPVRPMTHLLC